MGGLRSIRRAMIEPKAREAVAGMKSGTSAPWKSAEKRREYVAALRLARAREMAR